MKREARLLLDEAVDSFVLSVEHFNRPWDRGRHEAVLILLDRAFELALKAAIVHRGGQIREPGAAETIGFDKRYSPKALDRIHRALSQLDLEEVWQRHKPRGRKTTP